MQRDPSAPTKQNSINGMIYANNILLIIIIIRKKKNYNSNNNNNTEKQTSNVFA